MYSYTSKFTLQTSLVIRLEINIFGTNVQSSIACRPSSHWTFHLVPLDSPSLWLSSPYLGFSFSIDSFCAVFCQRWLHLTTKVNTIRTHLSCQCLRGGADLSESAETASRAPILTELWPTSQKPLFIPDSPASLDNGRLHLCPIWRLLGPRGVGIWRKHPPATTKSPQNWMWKLLPPRLVE